jgi:hypothetical protein
MYSNVQLISCEKWPSQRQNIESATFAFDAMKAALELSLHGLCLNDTWSYRTIETIYSTKFPISVRPGVPE